MAGPNELFVTTEMGKSPQRHDKFLINTLMHSSPSGPGDDKVRTRNFGRVNVLS